MAATGNAGIECVHPEVGALAVVRPNQMSLFEIEPAEHTQEIVEEENRIIVGEDVPLGIGCFAFEHAHRLDMVHAVQLATLGFDNKSGRNVFHPRAKDPLSLFAPRALSDHHKGHRVDIQPVAFQ